jgi:capsule polysaccharide export protein KpsC/LpsZ
MNAQAVATVTGTIGWEAMVLGKPVIVFGLKWYEKYEGVLKITDEEAASRIRGFLANFSHDEKKLYAYLNALGKNSSLVYSFRGIKGKVNVSEAECVERLVKLVQESICPGPVQ